MDGGYTVATLAHYRCDDGFSIDGTLFRFFVIQRVNGATTSQPAWKIVLFCKFSIDGDIFQILCRTTGQWSYEFQSAWKIFLFCKFVSWGYLGTNCLRCKRERNKFVNKSKTLPIFNRRQCEISLGTSGSGGEAPDPQTKIFSISCIFRSIFWTCVLPPQGWRPKYHQTHTLMGHTISTTVVLTLKIKILLGLYLWNIDIIS